ncbi:hypothetical protein FPV67DRAFT_1456097 [Lyophyllum atratum]|nr:hypothetical protein FPV67DRAFT_1456097 [Lyophyllum atratum]
MFTSILPLVPVFLLASKVPATALAPRSIHQLLTRQSAFDPSIIPAQCKDTCNVLVSTISNCEGPSVAPSCGCSIAEERGFVNCLNCILGVGIPSQAVIDSTQTFVDQYVSICKVAGVSLPATTISGGITTITSTPVSGTSPARPTSFSLTRSPTTARQATFTGIDADPTADDTAATPNPSNPLDGLNNAARTRGRETQAAVTGAAAAAAIALVVFF